MGVSKVIIDDEVKLDLTADTVEPAALKAGYTAHNAAGNNIVGTMSVISLEDVYPVGAIYMSAAATNPGTLFGFGTWEQIKDRFLLAAGDAYAAGATGGAAEIALTVNEMPEHNHGLHFSGAVGPYASPVYGDGSSQEWGYSPNTVSNSGGGQPHNNMPPYLAVYVWKRTA